VAETQHKQLALWGALVCTYCREKKKTSLDISKIDGLDLFNNKAINRKVLPELAQKIFDHIVLTGTVYFRVTISFLRQRNI
jgi:hypothetical protein